MKKIIRFSAPFNIAFLFLGILIWLAGTSSRAVADPMSSNPEAVILVTTLEDELNADGDCSLRYFHSLLQWLRAGNSHHPR